MVSKYEHAQRLADNLPAISKPIWTGRVIALGDNTDFGDTGTLLDDVDVFPESRRIVAAIANTRLCEVVLNNVWRRALDASAPETSYIGVGESARRWGRLSLRRFTGDGTEQVEGKAVKVFTRNRHKV